MADIIKLDEYLEKHKYNIVKAMADALGMDPNNEDDVQNALRLFNERYDSIPLEYDRHQFEMQVVQALEDEDAEKVRELLQVSDEDTWESEQFGGVDVTENYNFKCGMKSEAAKNSLMDWLEENSVEYLIDNAGNFAIKCPSRKVQYHIARQVEHLTNKWDKPSFGKTIDPDEIRKGLGDIRRPALADDVDETNVVQGPWQKQTPKDPRDYEAPEYEPATVPSKADKAASMDDERLFFHVYNELTNDMIEGEYGGDIDKALDYLEIAYNEDENERIKLMRDKIKQHFIDEWGEGFGIQQAFKKKKVGHDAIVKNEDAKDSLFKDTTTSMSPFSDVDDDDEDEDDDRFESVTEAKKKSAKARANAAKAKLDDPVAQAKARAGYDPSKLLGKDEFKPKKTTLKNKKKEQNKKATRKKVSVDEKLEEGVLGGLTAMPTVGRIKELAGIKGGDCSMDDDTADVDGKTTITIVPDPGTPKIQDMPGANEANELLHKAFEIYDTLRPEDKQAVKNNLMNLMLKESISVEKE